VTDKVSEPIAIRIGENAACPVVHTIRVRQRKFSSARQYDSGFNHLVGDAVAIEIKPAQKGPFVSASRHHLYSVSAQVFGVIGWDKVGLTASRAYKGWVVNRAVCAGGVRDERGNRDDVLPVEAAQLVAGAFVGHGNEDEIEMPVAVEMAGQEAARCRAASASPVEEMTLDGCTAREIGVGEEPLSKDLLDAIYDANRARVVVPDKIVESVAVNIGDRTGENIGEWPGL
jgi:hypothetical protein